MRHLFGFMYETALINIVAQSGSITIYIEMLYNEKIKNSVEHTFILNDSYNHKLLEEYIKPFIQETPYFYISMLDASIEQGAIPTCNRQKFSLFKDLSTSKYICIDNKWACYTSKPLLEDEMKITGKFGVDFVFSPFVVLKEFFKDKIGGKIALFVFIQEDSVTLAVFQESYLLYGRYIDTSFEITEEEELLLEDSQKDSNEENGDEEINLDEIDLENDLDFDDTLDTLDSLDDIEDLDNMENLESDEALEEQLEENLEAVEETPQEESSDDIERVERSTKEFKYYSLIQQSLASFYNDERYESDFIEHVYVADAIHLSGDFKRLVQDEMFLNLYVRSIDPVMEVAHLAKKEVFEA